MRQRIGIALALCNEPDEPTFVQAQILALIDKCGAPVACR